MFAPGNRLSTAVSFLPGHFFPHQLLSALTPKLMMAETDHAKNEHQRRTENNRCSKGGCPDSLVRKERRGSILIDNLLCVAKHKGTDGRTNDARDQYLADDADSLELTGAVLRNPVADHSSEHCHACHVTGHHQKRTNKYRYFCPGKKQDHISDHQNGHRRNYTAFEALHVINTTVPGGNRRRQHNCRCHDQHIVRHPQRLLIVENQIGHVSLD